MIRDIHLWYAPLDVGAEEVTRLEALLSTDERERASRAAPHDPQRRFVVARGRLREILGREVGIPPAAVRFHYGRSGKPELPDGSGPRFSMSHSAELAVVALHPRLEIGVDLERLRPFPPAERIARRFFLEREHRALAALPVAERERAFFTCWTRKEACAKALGGDLVPALGRFEVTFAPGDAPRVLRFDGDGAAAARWTLAALEPPEPYIGAVALDEASGS